MSKQTIKLADLLKDVALSGATADLKILLGVPRRGRLPVGLARYFQIIAVLLVATLGVGFACARTG